MDFNNFYFPHKKVRPIQDKLIESINRVIINKKHIVIHAPTGLGKTASALSPAITYALKEEKTVLFLTSKNTQQIIALNTVKEMKKKYNLKLQVATLIGKKNMCLQPHINLLSSHDFFEYCKKAKEDKVCEYFNNYSSTNGKITSLGKNILERVEKKEPMSTGEIISLSKQEKICPYELALSIAKKSQVIIGDYYYLLHPIIAKNFLKKIEKEHENLIVIIDEGHNLPSRIRDLASIKLSSFMIKRALIDVKKLGFKEAIPILAGLQQTLLDLTESLKDERKVEQSEFIKLMKRYGKYDEMIKKLDDISNQIREIKNQTSLSAISEFMSSWLLEEEGFFRIIKVEKGKKEDYLTLYKKCIDPSVIMKEIISKVHSTILMSGTLLPLEMYRDLLGFPKNTEILELKSPFPEKNKLNLIVPRTTTQYKKRDTLQYKNIGEKISKIVNSIPGNVAVFFPSYYLRDQIQIFIKSEKELLIEHSGLSKDEKERLLEKFKSLSKEGAILLACQSGSFGEGIDLPGDELKGVIIVGLPLAKPDLETKELIDYYNKKFSKGWEYGYVAPAFSKILQSAGRCIRTEKDKGIIVFLDERFAWPNYKKYFIDGEYNISLKPEEDIEKFFGSFSE